MSNIKRVLVRVLAGGALIGGAAIAILVGMARYRESGVHYYNPDWSPDGSEIVFESTREGAPAIYRIRVDGSGLRKVAEGPGVGQPSWSADGRTIVFITTRDGPYQLYIMNSDGTNQRRLTHGSADDYSPDLSPDGRQVAFQSRSGRGSHDIDIISTDGSGRRRLTDGQADYMSPRWSPDGMRLAFVRASGRNATQEIHIRAIDGSISRQLTSNSVQDRSPEWSSDGRTIYFVSRREGSPSVHAMGADGTVTRRIADGKVVTGTAISPDGRFLAYDKSVRGKAGIYVYDIEKAVERLLIGE
jgi:Tol biopolymer transport system component